MHTRARDIADWLRDRVTAAGARGLVVGLSGGLDSAVVACLCQMAAPGNVVAVILPCQSDPQDERDARLVADSLNIPAMHVDLEPVYVRLTSELLAAVAPSRPRDQSAIPEEADSRARLALANVKPRLRMASLYFVANSLNYLVAGTGNRCELTIGYFTKYGDGGADVLPIGDLLKSEVRELARDLNIPDSVIARPPSAGLWLGQTDEAEMGFTYDQLERYLADGPEAVPPALALRIERLVRHNAHKRAAVPTPSTPSRTDEFA